MKSLSRLLGYTLGVGLFASLFLWSPEDTSLQAVWVERWGWVAALIGTVYATSAFRWKTKLAPLFIVYFLINAILCNFLGGYFNVEKELVLLLRSTAQDQIILLFVFLAFLRVKIDLRSWLLVGSVVMGVGILLSSTRTEMTPFITNPSMAATFVVLASRVAPWAILPALFAHSYTACITWFIATLFRCRRRVPPLLWAGLFCIGLGGYLKLGHIPDNGRFQAWTTHFTWWLGEGWRTIFLGAGAGSTKVWYPLNAMLKSVDGQANIVWLLHNDFLQATIEYGLIGMALILGVFFELFTIVDAEDRVILLAYAVASMTNFPAHYALTAFVVWDLFKRNLLADEVPDIDGNFPCRQRAATEVCVDLACVRDLHHRE